MKKTLLGITGLLMCGSMLAAPQALFVKKGDSYTKYNFGIAGDLKFFDNGHKLKIAGYNEIIDLDNIDYISFNAPTVEGMLTPYAQKQKMIEIGEAVNGLIDLKSIGDLLRMQDAFFNHHYNGDNTFHPASEYEVPEEYWNVHKEAKGVIKTIGALGSGNPAGIRTLRARAIDLYRASDYFGVYAADQQKEEWVKTTDADYLEIQYKGYDGTNYSMRLDCSESSSRWETEDFIGEMPETMTLTFKVNSIKIADMTITSKLVKDESIDVETVFNASGYKVTDTLAITDRLMTDTVKVYFNGKESITATSTINGANLVKYDIIKEDVKEALHYHDEDGNCCGENPEALIAHFHRAQSDVDVLGMLQVKGRAFDFTRLYNMTGELPDEIYDRPGYPVKSINSDGSVITVCTWEKEEVDQYEDVAGYLNNYTDVQFFYDGKPAMQGFLTFELQEDGWEDTKDPDEYQDYGFAYALIDNRLIYVVNRDDKWTGGWGNQEITADPKDLVYPSKIRYVNYDIMPRLTFFDMTSYAFEDFFDEGTFKDLINDYDGIIDTYDSITGQK